VRSKVTAYLGTAVTASLQCGVWHVVFVKQTHEGTALNDWDLGSSATICLPILTLGEASSGLSTASAVVPWT
jgi:hypothetical protein